MSELERVELVDSMLYIYIICAAIDIILAMMIIILIISKWRNASSAVNPSQFRLRNFYILSLLISCIACLIHGIIVVFGINDYIIPGYNKLLNKYDEAFIFGLCLFHCIFYSFIFISFILRMKIIYSF